MAHRDFAARRGSTPKKKSKKINKKALIGIALVTVAAFGGGLYLLKSKTPPEEVKQLAVTPEKTPSKPKSVLPTRPEEVWSYIKALETRTVPTDKGVELTEEQRKILADMEKEQKAAEAARKLAEQRKQEEQMKAEKATATAKAETKAETKTAEPKVAESPKTERTEPKKTEPAKIETAKKADVKPEKTADKSSGKRFGLQCGAFKNKAQAENLQARLAMAGLNAQVASSEEWNRVRVGTFATRDAAVQAQEKAKSVTACVVIGM